MDEIKAQNPKNWIQDLKRVRETYEAKKTPNPTLFGQKNTPQKCAMWSPAELDTEYNQGHLRQQKHRDVEDCLSLVFSVEELSK